MSKSTKEKELHKLEKQWKEAQKNMLKIFLEDDDFDNYLKQKQSEVKKD